MGAYSGEGGYYIVGTYSSKYIILIPQSPLVSQKQSEPRIISATGSLNRFGENCPQVIPTTLIES